MKCIFSCCFAIVLIGVDGFSQTGWSNYVNDRQIADVCVEGNDVWVGSQGGLTRTNLVTGAFETFLAANSPIVGGGISAIDRAPDGSMWFGSENGGLFHLKNDVWTHYLEGIVADSHKLIRDLQVLPNGDVWCFVEDSGDRASHRLVRIRDGIPKTFGNLPPRQYAFYAADAQTIYLVNLNTVYVYDVDAEVIVRTYDPGNSILDTEDRILSVEGHGNGTIVIPTTQDILQIRGDSLSILALPGISVYRSFRDNVGNVYFQPHTQEPNGIRLVRYNGIEMKYYKDADLEPYPVNRVPIFSGADGQGRLYGTLFNTESEYTLYMFDEDSWQPVRTQIVPMLDNYQDDVQSDCHGNMWFGSRQGVDVRYANGNWAHFAVPPDHLENFRSPSMTVDPVTCDVWFANAGNTDHPLTPGIIRISNGVMTGFLYGHSNVYDIEATVDGRIYFFSGNSGFGYIEDDVVHEVPGIDPLTVVFSIDSDSKGVVYFSDWYDDLHRYDGVNLTTLGAPPGVDRVYDIYADHDDLVWVTTTSGLFQFDGLEWHDYSDVWPRNTINGMVQEERGNFWISTWYDGLYYWDRESRQQYTIWNSGLTTDNLQSVALTPDGDLIVTQRVGISVLDIPDVIQALRGIGTVYYDHARNGAFDPGPDIPVPGKKVIDADRQIWSITNAYGRYAFYTDEPGTYIYQHEIEAPTENTTDNPQAADFFDAQSVLPDFGFWQPSIPNVTVDILNDVPVCNRDFEVLTLVRNRDLVATSGLLAVHHPDDLVLVETDPPATWTEDGRLYFGDMTLGPLGVTPVRLVFTAPGLEGNGSPLQFAATFMTADSVYTRSTVDTVLCSYDPNDKRVEPTGPSYRNNSLIADPLKYTIRFQNEGTYKAFDVVIIDTLESRLDPSTFELLGSSHDVETTITAEGVVTFTFRDIDLPPKSEDESGSQGFVAFTVRPHATLWGRHEILNTAHIYFDFNPPIVTNTTAWNVVDDLGIVSTLEHARHIAVHPNPARGQVYVRTDEAMTFRILDTHGRTLRSGRLLEGDNQIDLDETSGIYYLQAWDGHRRFDVVKLVVF